MKRDLSKPLAPSDGLSSYSEDMLRRAERQEKRAKRIKKSADDRKAVEDIKGKSSKRSDRRTKRAKKVMDKAVTSYDLHKLSSKDKGFNAPNALR